MTSPLDPPRDAAPDPVSAPEHVARQYADEFRLETRTGVWRPGPDGRDPVELALAAVAAGLPEGRAMPDVLEVGCGTGAFAALFTSAHPEVAYLATDSSPRFVELTRARGVPSQLMDAQTLLAGPASYDVVVALWMLYHVPDLDRALAELRRVLRPGGRLVAVTNGDRHLADLLSLAGGGPVQLGFSSQNGEAALRRHFDEVTREDLETRAVFENREAALAYLRTLDQPHPEPLPADGWPREFTGEVTLFTAR